jgi:hypothetical protein
MTTPQQCRYTFTVARNQAFLQPEGAGAAAGGGKGRGGGGGGGGVGLAGMIATTVCVAAVLLGAACFMASRSYSSRPGQGQGDYLKVATEVVGPAAGAAAAAAPAPATAAPAAAAAAAASSAAAGPEGGSGSAKRLGLVGLGKAKGKSKLVKASVEAAPLLVSPGESSAGDEERAEPRA